MSETRIDRLRRPAAAGTFYPAEAEELARMVDELLAGAEPPDVRPTSIVVPHAGYVYSGSVAATGYATLRPIASEVSRVVILGPAHFVPTLGCTVPSAEAWATPLGEVPIDAELRQVALGCGATADDGPHVPEHSLEVQLPFLQRILGRGFTVLPVAVGASAPPAVADLIAALGGEAMVVVSTDLSHYNDLETARRLDRRTADAVLARDPGALGPEDACGVHALRGLVEHARREELEVRLLDLRTSGDTAGDPWQVVGYAAIAIAQRVPAHA